MKTPKHTPSSRRPSPARRTKVSARPAPDRWAWHRKALLTLRGQLSAEVDERRAAGRGPLTEEAADAADTAERRIERGLLDAELHQDEGLLEEVEAALGRIAAGTYGTCEATGRAIPAERLRAVPWARLTQEAAAASEARAR
jgi:RNA polymerase-binding transcription factor DksA